MIRPIELLTTLANQRAPSGPATIPSGLTMLGSVKVETTPSVVIRPIELFPSLVNHSAPSGPTVMASGAFAPAKSVTTPVGVICADRIVAFVDEPEIAVRPSNDSAWIADTADQ